MLDREDMLEFMRLRGKLNALVAEFMIHYSAARVGNDRDNYDANWHWLWNLSDLSKVELLNGIIEHFGGYDPVVNTAEAFAEGVTRYQGIQALFSITQMTASLGKPSAV